MNNYDELQEAQIKLGRLQELTDTDIALYDDPVFDYMQMEQIRLGLKNGLSADCVKVYAQPLLSAERMLLLRFLAEQSIDIQLLAVAARSELSCMQSYEVFAAIVAGLKLDQVCLLATNKLTYRQIASTRLEVEIAWAAEKSIAVDLHKKTQEAEHKNASVKKPDIIKLDGFTDAQLAVINLAKANGATDEQLKVICGNVSLTPAQMQEIRWGFESNHLTIPQVMLYADVKYSENQMSLIRKGLKLGLTEIEVQLMAKPEFSIKQMSQLLKCFEAGLKAEQIVYFADPQIPAHQMHEYRMGLLDNMTLEELGLVEAKV